MGALLGIGASVAALIVGAAMIVAGFREDKKQEGFSFHRSELKYNGAPVAVCGLLCTLIQLKPYFGEWVMHLAAGLFAVVAGLLCLGGIGAIFTQLDEIRWPFRKRKR